MYLSLSLYTIKVNLAFFLKALQKKKKKNAASLLAQQEV